MNLPIKRDVRIPLVPIGLVSYVLLVLFSMAIAIFANSFWFIPVLTLAMVVAILTSSAPEYFYIYSSRSKPSVLKSEEEIEALEADVFSDLNVFVPEPEELFIPERKEIVIPEPVVINRIARPQPNAAVAAHVKVQIKAKAKCSYCLSPGHVFEECPRNVFRYFRT